MPRRKRAHGEGTLYRRSDGRWCARLMVRGKAIYRYAKTQAEARRQLDQLRLDAAAGIRIDRARAPLSTWLAMWLAEIAPHSNRASSLDKYEIAFRLHVIPGLGNICLADLSKLDIQLWVNRLLTEAKPTNKERRGLASNSVRAILMPLQSALQAAVDADVIAKNPAAKISVPRPEPSGRVQSLSAAEIRALLATAERIGDPYTVFYTVMVGTGVRPGENAALTWAAIDFDQRLMSVKQTVTRTKSNGLMTGPPKTPRSSRLVPMADMVVDALRRRQREQADANKAGWRDDWSRLGLVYTNSRGGLLEPSNVRKRLAETLKKADLPPITLHELRDSCVTFLLDSGVPLHIVMQIIGHVNPDMTFSYAHPSVESLRVAATTVDQAQLWSKKVSPDGPATSISD